MPHTQPSRPQPPQTSNTEPTVSYPAHDQLPDPSAGQVFGPQIGPLSQARPGSLAAAVHAQGNDHRRLTAEFEHRTGIGWHQPTPTAALTALPELPAPAALSASGTRSGGRAAPARVSVLLPARNSAGTLPLVLDALQAQSAADHFEVIAVDDASDDATAQVLRKHPRVDRAVRLADRIGCAAVRNVAAYLATGDLLLSMDADMVLPAHVIGDFAARSRPNAVLIGFRHNLRADHAGTPNIGAAGWLASPPAGTPNLAADHRVRWTPPAGVPMFYSGQVYEKAFDGYPLDHTADLAMLGHGRMYYDWDLPRMLVTCLAAMPRAAFFDVGGFDDAFTGPGWGCEDTHLGAALISAGCTIVPLRQAVGWHLDPPDAEHTWKNKLAGFSQRLQSMQDLFHQPPPTGRSADLTQRAQQFLRGAVTLR
ncbi:glycosyltransferase [Kineosporia rhizophila]|uniref:glycosyltransferase family 2 protein n=1 Tax=Kineosporia rhizophila TaxID=84633 RepID=UPI001E3CD94A|nr:glycosyltransferase family 2 protein [Kineosporia rhizophila]MCE0540742.1 glycosyltransferase [Kineosporia rhizophila]